MPWFIDAKNYFATLDGGVDLGVLESFGWHVVGECEIDDAYTSYHLWRDVWHLLVSTDPSGTLAYWIICGSG